MDNFVTPFWPYQQPQVPQYQQPAQRHQIPRFNGKQSAESLKMGPNEELIGLDTNESIMWLCTSDSAGRVTAAPFDITVHVEKPPVDVSALEDKVNDLTALMKRMEARLNEPRFANTQPV